MRLAATLASLGILAVLLPGVRPLPAVPSEGGSVAFTAVREARVDGTPGDPVARLMDRVAAGQVTLTYDSARGWLPSLLDALDIPASSQALVFSRTSLQTDRVAPWTPRALYFNDEVYVGWVQESPIMEIASIDPVAGAVFYTLDQTDPATPGFERQGTTCLMCHESKDVTGGVPGLIVRSVLVDRLGYPITDVHGGSTTDRTPIEKRWGGWYVTGTQGGGGHAGNTYAPDLSHEVSQKARYLAEMDFSAGDDVTDLDGRFYVDAYLTPHSDVVAILVLTHQTYVHNLISVLQDEATEALRTEAMVLAGRGGAAARDAEGGHLPSTLARLQGPVERLVRGLLFVDEAPLPGPVRGTSTFARDFAARGPRDDRGRSLRELDLDTRLFRRRMSFLVYGEAFDALPEPARLLVARRLDDVLSGRDGDPAFGHIPPEERTAIREILEATKPDLLALAAGG